MRLASIHRSRYWMNVTDIGEALYDLRPAVIDLIDLLEEMQQQKPEAVPCDPGQSAGHRFDCHPFNPSDLTDLLDHSVLDALSKAATIDCGTRGHDRRVQLF